VHAWEWTCCNNYFHCCKYLLKEQFLSFKLGLHSGLLSCHCPSPRELRREIRATFSRLLTCLLTYWESPADTNGEHDSPEFRACNAHRVLIEFWSIVRVNIVCQSVVGGLAPGLRPSHMTRPLFQSVCLCRDRRERTCCLTPRLRLDPLSDRIMFQLLIVFTHRFYYSQSRQQGSRNVREFLKCI